MKCFCFVLFASLSSIATLLGWRMIGMDVDTSIWDEYHTEIGPYAFNYRLPPNARVIRACMADAPLNFTEEKKYIPFCVLGYYYKPKSLDPAAAHITFSVVSGTEFPPGALSDTRRFRDAVEKRSGATRPELRKRTEVVVTERMEWIHNLMTNADGHPILETYYAPVGDEYCLALVFEYWDKSMRSQSRYREAMVAAKKIVENASLEKHAGADH